MGELNNGNNPYRKGRPHGLDDPERVRLAAALFANGATREEMAEELGVSVWTITQWRKDPRVRTQVKRLTEDRILRITSRIDKVIEHRLMDADEIDNDTLIRIRKEFLGGAFRNEAEGGNVDDGTINKTMEALEDTNLAEGLRNLLDGLKQAQTAPEVE